MEQLNWNPEDNTPLDFINHYWKWIETTFEQWSKGTHEVTKAYEADNDYLGFTDDYDFCWGPETPGNSLEDPVYPDDWKTDNNTDIEYITDDYGFKEYQERLWGVYSKTLGEIYLLKANEQLTDWERHEQLLFAPSGSQKPSIEFNKDGRYEIAVEVKPSGTDIREVWLMSYPYEGDSIRKICDGTEPQLYLSHNEEIQLFYTNQDQTRIFYRLENEDYGTEHEITDIHTPERQLHLIHAYKIYDKNILDKPYPEFEPDPVEYDGKTILFYRRDDDYQPLKYALTDLRYKYEFLYKEPVFYFDYPEDSKTNIVVSGIEWEDMRYILNLYSDPDTTVTIKEQRQQDTVNTELDSAGEGEAKVLPYDTVYDVDIEKDGVVEDRWGILVFDTTDTDDDKEMDIVLPFHDVGEEVVNPDINMDLLWVLAGITVNITTFDNEDSTLFDGAEVTIHGHGSQDTVTKTTDSNGEVTFEKILSSETVYDVTLNPSGLDKNEKWGLLLNQDPGTEVSIDLPYIRDLIENSNLGFLFANEWETMLITTTITVKDMAGNAISDATVTIKAQRAMEEKTGVTDSNGQITKDLMVYDTPYEVVMEHSNYLTEEDLWLLVQNNESKSRTVDMYISDGAFIREENNNIGVSIESLLWLEV